MKRIQQVVNAVRFAGASLQDRTAESNTSGLRAQWVIDWSLTRPVLRLEWQPADATADGERLQIA